MYFVDGSDVERDLTKHLQFKPIKNESNLKESVSASSCSVFESETEQEDEKMSVEELWWFRTLTVSLPMHFFLNLLFTPC